MIFLQRTFTSLVHAHAGRTQSASRDNNAQFPFFANSAKKWPFAITRVLGVRHCVKFQYLNKGWFIFGLVALLMGLIGLYTGKVIVYERALGFYSVTRYENGEMYWMFVIMYFHMCGLFIFISLKEYYPLKLWSLMNFDEKTKLKPIQIVFIILVALSLYGSTFWISGVISNA